MFGFFWSLLFFILALVIPTWSVTDATLGGLKKLHTGLESGELQVPPPAAKVQDWPLVGEKLFAAWSSARQDLEAFMQNLYCFQRITKCLVRFETVVITDITIVTQLS